VSLKPTGYVCPKCGSQLYTREGSEVEVQFCLNCGYDRWHGFCSKLNRMIWTPDECKGCEYYWEYPEIHGWGCSYPIPKGNKGG